MTNQADGARVAPLIRKDYVGRSGIAALAMFLPNIRVFLILLLLGLAYSADVRAAVALGGSVSGLVTVLASGFVATTVRSTTLAYRKSGGISAVPGALAKELRAAVGAAILLVAVGVLVAVVGMLIPGPSRLFAIYVALALASIALSPVMFVLNGAFQALQRDGRNLSAAVVGTCVQLTIAAVVVAIAPEGPVAIGVLGLAVSLSAIIGCAIRTFQLRRLGALRPDAFRASLVDVSKHPLSLHKGLLERGAASVDGIVFVAFFTVAIMVATVYDPFSGAVVGLTVTLMRSTVVPLKQFGLVGGRFVLREQGTPGAMTLASIQRSCAIILLVASSILIAVRLATPVLNEIPWIVIWLMVTQLILEPWGSILYSYTKVVHSAYRGLPALLVSYIGVGATGLFLAGILNMATPLGIWTVLIATRIVFVGMQVLSLIKSSRSTTGSEASRVRV